MPELIQSIKVTIAIDTNKRSIHQDVSLKDESLEEFAQRVLAELRQLFHVRSPGGPE